MISQQRFEKKKEYNSFEKSSPWWDSKQLVCIKLLLCFREKYFCHGSSQD